MGPALVEPDHRVGHLPGWAGRVRAAMGPALVEPDHVAQLVADGAGLPVKPQWGRLSSSRITVARSPRRRPPTGRNGAGSRRAGSLFDSVAATLPKAAAMGPALVEPDHTFSGDQVGRRNEPQWGRLSSSRITRPVDRPRTT